MLSLPHSSLGFLFHLFALCGSYKVTRQQNGQRALGGRKSLPRGCTSLLGALLSTLSMGSEVRVKHDLPNLHLGKHTLLDNGR